MIIKEKKSTVVMRNRESISAIWPSGNQSIATVVFQENFCATLLIEDLKYAHECMEIYETF